MKPNVYIFRGAPASGKGTLAAEFAKSLPKPVALIEQDKLRWGFHLIGRSVNEITSEEHRMAYENTLLIFEQYLKSRLYNIVVEGLFTWDNAHLDQGAVSDFMRLANQYGFEITSIVLTAKKAELMKRNIERSSYTTPKDEFNALYEGIYGTIDKSEIVIDSTHESPKDTLTKLYKLTAR